MLSRRAIIRIIAASTIVVAIASPSLAKAKANKNDRSRDPAAQLKKKVGAADLSSETKEKVNKVIEQHATRLKEAQEKVDAVLTSEQEAAAKQARKAARQAGKKAKAAKVEVEAATKLTDAQRSKLSSAQAELKSAQAALTKDLRDVLSAGEFAKLGMKAKKKS